MTETLDLDAVVIGGGVIGLAVARALALAGREVTLLEAESRLGNHSSSRNSEVIHAGIYYPQGSLKARLCVAGKELLYRYCAEKGIPHQRVGKIIVATRDEDVGTLQGILQKARDNGVTDLEWLEARQIAELEPSVEAVRGLLSPSTGIIDSHEFMSALRRDAEAHGAHVVLSSPVQSGEVRGRGGFELRVGGREPFTARCRTLVNAAGLTAQNVARSIRGVPAASIPGQYFAKGHYVTLSGRSPFRRLVYPVPVPGGLGVHVTLDMSGQARFGPDVSWLDGIDYAFDEQRSAAFYAAIRSYFPALSDGALAPGYTGIRPKLSPAGAPADDFVLQGTAEHGVPGLLSLYGIESPGLTSALALADAVLDSLSNDPGYMGRASTHD
ncbi:MAG TPA: NAD(P)/FAD-dependent oxidoreductase [Polyangiaceae bacterium]|nr:NAD(P)/FAD-dependent oxidoreductase [Polyangiaceae bacterium]